MILSLDLGSTSFKAAVVNEKLQVQGFHARRIKDRFAGSGQVEIEVGEAMSAVREGIREALGLAGARPSAVRVVAVTSQAQTFTLIDKMGQARMPFISWQDTRAAHSCETLQEARVMSDFGRHCSFGSMLPGLQLCQLKHLQETQPGFIDADALVVKLPAYCVYRWTGIAALDENLAAMSGLYSLALRTWWPAALRICGLQEKQLPELRRIGDVAGRTNEGAVEFGLPKGIPVVLAGNDQTAGAYAARLDENHGLLVTLGTAQTAYSYKARMPRPNPALIRGPFPQGGNYRMAADSCGGNMINWAETILARCATDKSFFNQAVLAPPGCQGLVFEPSCDGSRGAWRNIGLHHTCADFARSVLESLTRRMSEMIRQLGGCLVKTPVLVAGGGSEGSVWVQILSETLGVQVTVTQGQPVLGAARMALESA